MLEGQGREAWGQGSQSSRNWRSWQNPRRQNLRCHWGLLSALAMKGMCQRSNALIATLDDSIILLTTLCHLYSAQGERDARAGWIEKKKHQLCGFPKTFSPELNFTSLLAQHRMNQSSWKAAWRKGVWHVRRVSLDLLSQMHPSAESSPSMKKSTKKERMLILLGITLPSQTLDTCLSHYVLEWKLQEALWLWGDGNWKYGHWGRLNSTWPPRLMDKWWLERGYAYLNCILSLLQSNDITKIAVW